MAASLAALRYTAAHTRQRRCSVKQKHNKTFYIKVDKNTLVTRDKKEVPVTN